MHNDDRDYCYGTESNSVYYRVYLNGDGLIAVVAMQDFDECDYRADRFARDAEGNRLRFDAELAAKEFVNKTFRRAAIRPDDLLPSHPSLLLASDESGPRDAGGGPSH